MQEFLCWLFRLRHWSRKPYTCEKCGGIVETRGYRLCFDCDRTKPWR